MTASQGETARAAGADGPDGAAGAGFASVASGQAPTMVETGVPNLDRILGGGLQQGAVVMVIGAPGSGKTILAQQIAFTRARQGATTLYLTGYSETHEKLLTHNRRLSFFAPELIGTRVQLSNLATLLRRGRDDTEDAIVDTARAQHASLVVLDGFGSMRRFLINTEDRDQEIAHFVYSLGAKLALLGATLLIAVEGDPDERARYTELTVCDVILALRRIQHGTRHRRLLEVLKVRGAAPLDGMHPFTIGDGGILLSPRFESVVPPTEAVWTGGRASFGLPALDALLGGGLTAGTATLAAGSPGTGKTLLGLHFLAEGARHDEPGLFLGFMESAAQLRQKARTFGMDQTEAEASGRVRLLVQPGFDLEADRIAELLCADVERRGVRRLVIDSAADLARGLAPDARQTDFLAALVTYLRGRDVTTYLTLDVPTIVGPELAFADTPLSVLAENLLLLRHAEYRGVLHRLFLVLKMRFSDYDRTIREYAIRSGRGVQMAGPAPLADGLLTGLGRPLAEGRPEAQHLDAGRREAAAPTRRRGRRREA